MSIFLRIYPRREYWRVSISGPHWILWRAYSRRDCPDESALVRRVILSLRKRMQADAENPCKQQKRGRINRAAKNITESLHSSAPFRVCWQLGLDLSASAFKIM